MMPRSIPTLLVICLLLVSFSATADSYRCGRKLIRTGDTGAEVIRVCGSPWYKDRAKQLLTLPEGPRKVSVQRWFYKKNERALERMVLIYQGKVVGIEVGGR